MSISRTAWRQGFHATRCIGSKTLSGGSIHRSLFARTRHQHTAAAREGGLASSQIFDHAALPRVTLPFPSSVQVSVIQLPDEAVPQRSPYGRLTVEELVTMQSRFRDASKGSWEHMELFNRSAVIRVHGPQGSVYVTIPELIRTSVSVESAEGRTVDLHGEPESVQKQLDLAASAAAAPDAERFLHVSVTDSRSRFQSLAWKRTAMTLKRAIEGVAEGHILPLRIVGIGYRAELADLDPKGSVEDFQLLSSYAHRYRIRIERDPILWLIAQRFPDSHYAKLMSLQPLVNPYDRYGSSSVVGGDTSNTANRSTAGALPKAQKLLLKVGYSHLVPVVVPPHVTTLVPNPTRIVLRGTDYQQMFEFAHRIRSHRKPEPYKGKGIFVGDQTIKLKEKKGKSK
jgi:ribosomal protein L6P/L9E